MTAPARVPHGQVVYTGASNSPDGHLDDDELEPLVGSWTFTPTRNDVALLGGDDGLAYYVRAVQFQVTDVDGLGRLLDDDGHPGPWLPSNDLDATDEGRTWRWQARSYLCDGALRQSFEFDLPAGTVIDLNDVAPVTGDLVPPIVRGKGAYEIAVDNGFVGTEREWLDSLVGPQGPATPVGLYEPKGAAARVRLPDVVHPAPPTVTMSAPDAPSTIPSARFVSPTDPAIRYGATPGMVPINWYYGATSPASSTLDITGTHYKDFWIDTAGFEFALAANGGLRSYKLWVDGMPTSATVPTLTGDGGGRKLKLTWPTRGIRHVRMLTSMGLEGLLLGAGDTIWRSGTPLYSDRCYVLGDSFAVQGHDSVPPEQTYGYRMCELLGWEPLVGGEAGTGYLNAQGTGGRKRFLDRVVPDIKPTNPTRIVIGPAGTNDPVEGLQAAAAELFAKLAVELPGVPVYVFGCQYPNGTTDATRDAKDAAIAAAAATAPNVALFQSVKGWISTAAASLYTSADGLHPTTAGQQMYGVRAAQAIQPAA